MLVVARDVLKEGLKTGKFYFEGRLRAILWITIYVFFFQIWSKFKKRGKNSRMGTHLMWRFQVLCSSWVMWIRSLWLITLFVFWLFVFLSFDFLSSCLLSFCRFAYLMWRFQVLCSSCVMWILSLWVITLLCRVRMVWSPALIHPTFQSKAVNKGTF